MPSRISGLSSSPLDFNTVERFGKSCGNRRHGQAVLSDFLAAVDRLVAACHAHSKPAGVLAGSVETAEAWPARGFRVFAYCTDISLLQESLRSALARLRVGEGH
jgi:2-keto-3-deoxy-L-rhamnonate aldolase RhmA